MHCLRHILSSSHLLQSLLTNSGKELPSFRPTRDSEIFFRYAFSTLLAPSCGRIIKLVYFLSILLHSRPITDSFLFVYPKAMLNVQVCGHFLTHKFCSAFCTCSLVVCQILLLLPSGALQGAGHGMEVCGCGVQCAMGTHVPVRGIHG